MLNGFIKATTATPEITLADCAKNAREILRLMREAHADGIKLLTFPELCLTGYTPAIYSCKTLSAKVLYAL